jgi:hypothetical protein
MDMLFETIFPRANDANMMLPGAKACSVSGRVNEKLN